MTFCKEAVFYKAIEEWKFLSFQRVLIQIIEGFDLLIGVPFSKVFENIFGGTKFENCCK